MKVKFKCFKCKTENEFETEGQKQLLLEMKVEKKITYVVECKKCGIENQVESQW